MPITTLDTSALKVKILKIGKQRVIHVYGSGSSNANATLFNVDENNRPKSETRGIVTLMDSSGALSGTIVVIGTNGDAKLTGAISNKYLQAVLVYEVA